MDGTIKIGPAFFRKELDLYETRFALTRELIQNSVDAGATRIDIRYRNGVLRVADNGHGMDRTTLEDVYLRVGVDAPKGSDAIGGFGRARIITCFAQAAYKIRSADYILRGSGASYSIRSAQPTKGCAVTVKIQQDFEFNAKLQVDILADWSCLKAHLFYNGKRVPTKGFLAPRITEPQVTPVLGPPAEYFMTYVRVGGLLQFKYYSYTEGTQKAKIKSLVVDLPNSSWLTPSREAYKSNKTDDVRTLIVSTIANFATTKVTKSERGQLAALRANSCEASSKDHALQARWVAACNWALGFRAPAPTIITTYRDDDTFKARHVEIDGTHYLRLNAHTASGISDAEMHAIALHEVAHIAQKNHDEAYATELTNLIANVLVDII